MKNPYAPKPQPETELQQKARKLAAWHEQEAVACDQACSLSTDVAEKQRLLQQAQWHRDTAQAWRELQAKNSAPGTGGGFSVQG